MSTDTAPRPGDDITVTGPGIWTGYRGIVRRPRSTTPADGLCIDLVLRSNGSHGGRPTFYRIDLPAAHVKLTGR